MLPSSQYHELVQTLVLFIGGNPDEVKRDHVEDSRYEGKDVEVAACKEIKRQVKKAEARVRLN